MECVGLSVWNWRRLQVYCQANIEGPWWCLLLGSKLYQSRHSILTLKGNEMRPIKTLSPTLKLTQTHKMSKSIALSLLAQGNTGNEILSILDALATDNVSEQSDNQPTLNEIEFWSVTVLPLVDTGGSSMRILRYAYWQWFWGLRCVVLRAMRYIIFWVPLSYKTLKTRAKYLSL